MSGNAKANCVDEIISLERENKILEQNELDLQEKFADDDPYPQESALENVYSQDSIDLATVIVQLKNKYGSNLLGLAEDFLEAALRRVKNMNSGEDQSTNEAMSAVNDAALTSKAGRNMLSKAVDEFTPGPRFSDTNQKILNLLIKTLGVVDLRTGDASQTKVTAAPATAPTDDPDASKAT